ncbi:hypothetical protein BJY01DRAFT_213495 [Aspergillus pseudoustus]|uniref:Heterokaryon incompatibility domain-containing protein n=1 Tax=Aspergillus pseudoustus TaxID=1810923 RepID=A0ABR4K256_9EURO
MDLFVLVAINIGYRDITYVWAGVGVAKYSGSLHRQLTVSRSYSVWILDISPADISDPVAEQLILFQKARLAGRLYIVDWTRITSGGCNVHRFVLTFRVVPDRVRPIGMRNAPRTGWQRVRVLPLVVSFGRTTMAFVLMPFVFCLLLAESDREITRLAA